MDNMIFFNHIQKVRFTFEREICKSILFMSFPLQTEEEKNSVARGEFGVVFQFVVILYLSIPSLLHDHAVNTANLPGNLFNIIC